MAEKKVTIKPAAQPRRLREDAFSPLVDIYEEPDGTTVMTAEIPGVRQDKLDVQVDKGVLTIIGDCELPRFQDYAPTYVGFGEGQYFRAFALSDEVDRDNIQASLADGVLSIRLPKAAASRTKKIEVKGG